MFVGSDLGFLISDLCGLTEDLSMNGDGFVYLLYAFCIDCMLSVWLSGRLWAKGSVNDVFCWFHE